MDTVLINCHQVGKSYADRPVLDKLDLQVNKAQLFGLVGLNGCGKSTLIKAMLDLVALDHGSIDINGQPHREVDSRRNIAYLPDRFSPPAHLRGTDFIEYMLRLHGQRPDGARIEQVLQQLDLSEPALQKPVSKLSKGMTQKLGLASCLLSEKSLLILDEPMSGLDPRARVLFKQQLQQLKQQGRTIFFSSHMLADVEELADNMAVLHAGRIQYSGTPEGFRQQYQAESIEQAFMQCIGG